MAKTVVVDGFEKQINDLNEISRFILERGKEGDWSAMTMLDVIRRRKLDALFCPEFAARAIDYEATMRQLVVLDSEILDLARDAQKAMGHALKDVRALKQNHALYEQNSR